MTGQTFILASSRESARRLACLWACGKIPAMASDLDSAEALRQLHPRPLRYGLAIYLAKIDDARLDPVSVDLMRGSELAELTAQVEIALPDRFKSAWHYITADAPKL